MFSFGVTGAPSREPLHQAVELGLAQSGLWKIRRGEAARLRRPAVGDQPSQGRLKCDRDPFDGRRAMESGVVGPFELQTPVEHASVDVEQVALFLPRPDLRSSRFVGDSVPGTFECWVELTQVVE